MTRQNLFIGIDFPLNSRFQFQGVLRRIFNKTQIRTFAELPFDQSVENKPVGTLSAWLLFAGLKYSWR